MMWDIPLRRPPMKLAIHICAELEWKWTKIIRKIKKSRLRPQPFGKYVEHAIGKHDAILYKSGATKTRAAAACQFAVDKWHPDAVINLGTCGGVAENIAKRTIVVAKKTFQYDVLEKFGKPSSRFRRGLKTDLDLSWVDFGRDSRRLCIGTIASADQDLDNEQREILHRKGVLAADWESASIATICRLNNIRCLILRGVSDIPKKTKKSKKSLQERDYKKNTQMIMEDLFSIIDKAKFR
jgi:adenosylhomocysteine nucleosidase